MQVIREHAAGGELLCAFDDDTVVALLDHAGVKRRVALLMRRLGPVDLRRHDRVSAVNVVVAHEFVESDEVVGESPAGAGEKLRRRGIADKKAGDVIGGAAHQAKGRLRPGFREQAARLQIGMGARNLPGALHRCTGFGRNECHALADRKSTRLNSSHLVISYAVFCLKKKKKKQHPVCCYNKQKRTQKLESRYSVK